MDFIGFRDNQSSIILGASISLRFTAKITECNLFFVIISNNKVMLFRGGDLDMSKILSLVLIGGVGHASRDHGQRYSIYDLVG